MEEKFPINMIMSTEEFSQVTVPTKGSDINLEGPGRGYRLRACKREMGVQWGVSAIFCMWEGGNGANTDLKLIGAIWLCK